MKRILFPVIIVILLILSSCDVLLKTATSYLEQEDSLTTADVVSGLKEALKIGVDTAVVRLNTENGYYLDNAVKIDLPPETDKILEYAQKIPGVKSLIDNLVLQINRSAEDAALQAAPVFKNAITSMTFEDAWTILNGVDTAATAYLNTKTRNQLVELYKPIMSKSLNKELVEGVSANSTWSKITTKWNTFASSIAGKLLNVETVNSDLSEYVTGKAVDGLFVKVANQEKEIRTDVNARVTDILKKVFTKE